MRLKAIYLNSGFALSAIIMTACHVQNELNTPQISQTDIYALQQGFSSPPDTAKPRVWWHWLGGNVTKHGIDKDLAWMSKVGIGGVQNFDASLGTPKIIDELVGFNSPRWQELKKHAVQTAHNYGMEFAIAGSPGWSQTGGPWVEPKDGMKKLVWSEKTLRSGEKHQGALPQTSLVSGPFTGIGFDDPLKVGVGDDQNYYYQDIAVMAYPVMGADFKPVSISTPHGSVYNVKNIFDGDYNTAASFDISKSTQGDKTQPILNFDFEQSVTARSAQLYVPNARPPFSEAKYWPHLEAKIAGKWEFLAQIPLYDVPTSVSFKQASAKHFRLRYVRNTDIPPGLDGPVEGAIKTAIFKRPSEGRQRIGEFSLSPNDKVNLAEVRAGFGVVTNYTDLAAIAPQSAKPIKAGEMIDLSNEVDGNGNLYWRAPDERVWKIVRYGYSLTGKQNHPAAPDATGLEVDKFDAKAVRRYLDQYLSLFENALGDDWLGDKGLNAFLTDSIEVSASNWTEDMPAKFKEINGYDLMPWLPVLAGELMVSAQASEGFLYDWRQTLETLLVQEHYETIAKFTKEKSLTLYGEALENNRPVLGDV